MWSLLLVTLPTQPNAVRLRIWRALKALGCVALRDGAYVLPASHAPALEALAAEVEENGGSAQVLALSPKSDAQKNDILAQFDRSASYASWHQEAQDALNALPGLGETDARRRTRGLAEALDTLKRVDYYPGGAMLQADAMLVQLKSALDAHFSKGEPQAVTKPIPRLSRDKFQGKRWATRARPWVDRLASAWLIQRFIDPSAQFVWLADPAKAPKTALGFDYDGARFTHVGQRVTFEVLMASFGLETDTRLVHIGKLVHFLDAGGIPVDQAAGLEAVLGGLREVHTNDDALVLATGAVFDALYANAGRAPSTGENKP
jgi:hypothetical protein